MNLVVRVQIGIGVGRPQTNAHVHFFLLVHVHDDTSAHESLPQIGHQFSFVDDGANLVHVFAGDDRAQKAPRVSIDGNGAVGKCDGGVEWNCGCRAKLSHRVDDLVGA